MDSDELVLEDVFKNVTEFSGEQLWEISDCHVNSS